MSGIRISIAQGDDWVGVYVDGKKEFEGHSIPDFEWIDIIRKHFHEDLIDESYEIDPEWLEDHGSPLPDKEWDIRRGD